MLYLKIAPIVAFIVALEVSAQASLLGPTPTLAKRGSCDEPCGVLATVDQECKANGNYIDCMCTVNNLMSVDYCFACIVQDMELGEAYNEATTPGGSVTGEVMANSIEEIRREGEKTHQNFISDCAAAGVDLSGGSSTGGSSSGGSSGAASGGGTSGSAGGSSGGSSTGGAKGSSGGSSSAGSNSTSTTTLDNAKNSAMSSVNVAGSMAIAGLGALVALL